MHRNFSQTMTFRCNDPARLVEIAAEWDVQQATTDIMGFMGQRVLADRDDPGRYVIIADFGIVDPEVSAADEALRNNERPETQAAAARLRAVIDGDIEYRHYDELHRTDRELAAPLSAAARATGTMAARELGARRWPGRSVGSAERG